METEKVLLEATLTFLVRPGEVLLALKTRGIGAGRRNGYGGGPDKGESLEQASLRELHEEAGVTASIGDLEKVAVLDFRNIRSDGDTFVCRVHAFLLRLWQGTVRESTEMKDPKWYAIGTLPLAELMPADPLWLPRVLCGERLVAKGTYGPKQQELIGEMQIDQVTGFD